MNTIIDLTNNEKKALQLAIAKFSKYGVIYREENGSIQISIPKSSDINGMAGTELLESFRTYCNDNGISYERQNAFYQIIDDRYWSWREYISESSKDKVAEDLKDIKNQDLSLKIGRGNNDTLSHEESNYTTNNRDSHINVNRAMHKLLNGIRDSVSKVDPKMAKSMDWNVLLSKSLAVYGVLVTDFSLKEHPGKNQLTIKIDVPVSSELKVGGNEASGEYFARIISKSFHTIFDEFFDVKVLWAQRRIKWTVQACATMGFSINDSFDGFVETEAWYYFDFDSEDA